MSEHSVEQSPSETAGYAAMRRAIANYEFRNDRLGSDYLADIFLTPRTKFLLKFKTIRTKVKTKLNKFMPGIYEFVIARTAYFDSVFIDALNHNFAQIVLLGAGYDTRAFRFAKLNQATKILELDIAATQNWKVECLENAEIEVPIHVRFIPADLNKESLKNVLEDAGYENGGKTLFLWEGVSYYLEPESVDATLEFFRDSTHPESLIAFDYAIPVTEDNIGNYYGVKEFIQTMEEHHADEGLTFSIEDGNTETFLGDRGLEIVNHMDNEEIENIFLLKEDDSLIGQVTGHFRFVLASPIQEEENS